MIVQDFLFRKCRRGICRVDKWIVNTLFLYQAVFVMWFTHKNNIDRGLVGGDNNIFVMKERQVFSNIWVFKDWCRASAHRPTEFFLILICVSDLTLLTHSERVSKSSFTHSETYDHELAYNLWHSCCCGSGLFWNIFWPSFKSQGTCSNMVII